MHEKKCKHCGQPMLPPGVKKKPNEYDHAQGCPAAPKRRKKPEKIGCCIFLEIEQADSIIDLIEWRIQGVPDKRVNRAWTQIVEELRESRNKASKYNESL